MTLKLSNSYDITTIEKNINIINKVYHDLITSEYISYSTLYTQFVGLFKKTKMDQKQI